MCGRYSLTSSLSELIEAFDLKTSFYTKPRYNIAPTQMIPVCKRLGTIDFLGWGFIPHFKPKHSDIPRLTNARAESLFEKPSFRSAIEKQRCLIIADGFYEWKKRGKISQPYYMKLKGHIPFAMAGIWQGDTCAIITTEAMFNLNSIHSRMPLVLSKENYSAWLNPDLNRKIDLIPLLTNPHPFSWEVYPVSTKVNHANFDHPECINSLDQSLLE